MSFSHSKANIEEGDTAILYINPHKMHAIEVKSKIINRKQEEIDNVFQTQYGSLNVHSLIGKKYGSKVTLSKGWAYILHPTCELWTLTLPHRTQIIYTPDISMILFQLELRPGSVVCEAGTGSGSLTHALFRAVRPHGRVYSFDFHEKRVLAAKEEFENHGLSPVVSVQLRDVCTDGYGDELKSVADAVFLDLPLPWLAIPHAIRCLKNTGGRLASFSPCIEQVQKTSESLRTNGFTELQTIECLQREYSVGYRTQSMLSLDMTAKSETDLEDEKFLAALPPQSMPGHTGYLTFATLPPIDSRITCSLLTSATEEDSIDVIESDSMSLDLT